MNLAVANEDHNIYIFDMRKFDRALNILKDHVAAVMDVGAYISCPLDVGSSYTNSGLCRVLPYRRGASLCIIRQDNPPVEPR